MKIINTTVFFVLLLFYNFCFSQEIGKEIIFNSTQYDNVYKITINKYIQNPNMFNNDSASIVIGGSFEKIELNDSLEIYNNFKKYSYSIIKNFFIWNEHFLISHFFEDTNTLNLVNLNNDSICVQTYINDNIWLQPNNSIHFQNHPIIYVDIDKGYKYNVSAIDIDKDSLFFEIIDIDGIDTNYWIPDSLTINPTNGEINWSSIDSLGQYIISIRISEFRTGVRINYTNRIFVVQVDSFNYSGKFIGKNQWNINNNGNFEFEIYPDSLFSISFDYVDNNADSLFLSAYGETFGLSNNSNFYTIKGTDTITGYYEWMPDSTNIRNGPYIVVFRGTSIVGDHFLERDLTVVLYVKSINQSSHSKRKDQNILIYPIPASDKINISLNQLNVKNNTFSIYDILGKQVFRKRTSKNQMTVDISGLSNGVYLITVLSEDNFFHIRKIIVKH